MIKDSLVAVDTETFYTSDFSLKKMSVFQYVNSPQFDCYMVSAHSPSYGFVGRPTEFDWDQLSGKDLLMHNAMFDTCVIRRMQEQGLVPKTFKFGRIFDTADAVAYQRSLRALDTAAKVFLNRTVDKGVRHLMRGKTWADVEGTPLGDDLVRYARTDPEVTYALWEKVGPLWPEPERRVSELSREAGIRGIYVDRPRLEAGIDTLQQQLFEAGRAIPWEWEPDKTPLSPGVMREQCRIEGIPCPASFAIGDEACDQWFEDYAEKYPWIKATRDWRRINMLLQKLLNMRQGLLPDDRFQYSLKYFGAATGRWSGSERFNLQNLPRGEMFGVDLRSLLVADPGEEFLIIDYAAIEARVLLWMVGDQGMLDLIRKGTNLYQAHAERTMGWDPARGDMKALGKTDAAVKKLYLLAKARCLSEDTLVLTSRGYIPIVGVETNDAVWDGEEWVSHSGVIQRGEAAYDSLVHIAGGSYTDTHPIFTGPGSQVRAGGLSERELAQAVAWKEDSCDSWAEIWQLARVVARACFCGWGSVCQMRVRKLQKSIRRGVFQLNRRCVKALFQMRPAPCQQDSSRGHLGDRV